jgi:hypothetical protein
MKDRDITQEGSGNDSNPHSEPESHLSPRILSEGGHKRFVMLRKIEEILFYEGGEAMRKVRDYFKGTELREDSDAFTTERRGLGKSSLARCRRKTRQSRKRQQVERKRLEVELANWKPEVILIKKNNNSTI